MYKQNKKNKVKRNPFINKILTYYSPLALKIVSQPNIMITLMSNLNKTLDKILINNTLDTKKNIKLKLDLYFLKVVRKYKPNPEPETGIWGPELGIWKVVSKYLHIFWHYFSLVWSWIWPLVAIGTLCSLLLGDVPIANDLLRSIISFFIIFSEIIWAILLCLTIIPLSFFILIPLLKLRQFYKYFMFLDSFAKFILGLWLLFIVVYPCKVLFWDPYIWPFIIESLDQLKIYVENYLNEAAQEFRYYYNNVKNFFKNIFFKQNSPEDSTSASIKSAFIDANYGKNIYIFKNVSITFLKKN